MRQSCRWQVFAGRGKIRFPSAQTTMSEAAALAALSVGSRRSRIPLGERTADAKQQYHRLPCGQVVSKCALRDKKERSAPVSRNAPPNS